MSRQNGTWRIGELARETGLTVRTLHHYDQLGLLSPLSRTEGGHRCYSSGDVQRLHRIVALRSLGISLQQIGTVLDGDPDPAGLLRRQRPGPRPSPPRRARASPASGQPTTSAPTTSSTSTGTAPGSGPT